MKNRLRSEEVNLQYRNPLANDYLSDFARVQQFFTYNPYRRESFEARYNYLKERTFQRDTVAAALRQYNSKLGAGPETLNNIELLSQPGTVAVVTGQQAGILGGPLYSVYKALTAVQLAAKLTRELNRPVVPVFWIAAEDHDYLEVNDLHVLDREGRPVRLKLDYTPAGKYSVGDIAVPGEYSSLLAELAEKTSDTEFKPELLDLFEKTAGQSGNLAEWFGRIMLHWLGFAGLIMVNPMEQSLRGLEKDLFKTAALRYGEVNNLVAETGMALAAKGYPVAVEKDPGNVNLFMYRGRERLALLSSGDRFGLRGSGEIFTMEEILQKIEADPSGFSPNVVLRPLSQDVLFPTIAYVGGPGEINYCCQYKQVYELFGMEMPVIFPRANLTLVEGSVENYLRKYGLSLKDIVYRPDEVGKQHLDSRDEVGIEGVFAGLERDISSAYEKALPLIMTVDQSLDKLGRENRDRVLAQVEWLKGKTLQAHRKANDVFVRQFRKLCNSLAPGGQLQERYLSGAYFALKYGPTLFRDLARGVDFVGNTQHKLAFIKN